MSPQEIKEYNKKYRELNKDAISKQRKEYRNKNKIKLKEYHSEYNKINVNQIKEQRKIFRENNKTLIKIYNKNYRQNNKEKISEIRRKYLSIKNNTDVVFKLKNKIRISIIKSLTRKNYTKINKTIDILGCSYDEFKTHLESKFESWMNWDNRGLYNGELNYGWDIDHIIPISSAKTEEDIIRLNHYTNLQPLCSKFNRDIKRNELPK